VDQPVARINIDLYPDGRIIARGNVPSRQVLNAMITTAWQDLLGVFREREAKAANNEAILVPPPGFAK
jgi:hypothetical protein